MAQSVVCMAGVASLSALSLEGLGAQRASNASLLSGSRSAVVARAGSSSVVASMSSSSHEEENSSVSRRSMLSLVAAALGAGAFVKHADAVLDIELQGPPPLSGGLPGTENADEARDTDLDLKKRFFLQALPATAAVGRVKEAAQEIVSVKNLIAKKAWPYVQNDLRSKAQTLGFDLKIIIDSKAKGEKKELSALKSKLFDTINALDYAARAKSSTNAEKYYDQTVALLNKVIEKIA